MTNESDMGADLMLKSSPQSLRRLLQIAAGNPRPTDEPDPERSKKTIESRVDVKTTQNKLQTDTIEKFAADVLKHPKCTGHILMGGSNLTGPAQRKFDQYKTVFEQKGKVLGYISNEGVGRLEAAYAKPIAPFLEK